MSKQSSCELRIEADQFKELIEHYELSYRDVAAAATQLLRREKQRPQLGVSHTLVSNLANGKAKNIHPRRAKAIEKVLKQPTGHIFRLQLFSVPRNTDRTAA